MNARRLLSLPLLLVMLLASAVARAQYAGPAVTTGQSGTATVVTTNPTLLYPSVPEYRLGPGDLISVAVLGETNYASDVRLDISGQVLLPYIGLVSLDGLSVVQAELLIEHKLIAAGIYVNPQVVLQVTESSNNIATIIGEAHGVVPINGRRTLLQVLAAAGGLPSTASHVVTIDRPGVAQPIIVNLGSNPEQSAAANIPILPGDTIIVARVGVAYMVGAFKTQGAIPLIGNAPMTLMEATALSGGPTYQAKYKDLRLIRTINGRRTLVKLDIHKILYGQAPDPILEPDDIVFLPDSAFKAFMTNGSSGIVVGMASLALSAIAILRY